ncbi:hypothetical protein [Streptomyces diastatochromogenes]|uniref:Uncharacterized protein n=1 Tax=Streptomyces diastatochromogenes TaxID=42236 RepID=A0A233SPQ2_STRDA|nr:hypothetical protein [Streptomyces diastatochromogenes]MCZ0987924.1 hypothetical protein [Streptomyces diastatochromogenes]OXY97637.1 hypothetical protein BEK98_08770 [Streptomyces diastatochromogenes]
MTDLIRRLATWVGLLLFPPGEEPVPDPTSPAVPWPTQPLPLPRHRSPYGLDTPLDATAARAVRPYLVAHEQREWHRELALATLGQDMPGPYWIHGLEVA